MSSILEQILPEYMVYWYEVGVLKFIRVFWYFVIFELTRYITADYIVAFWYYLTKKSRSRKWNKAKRALHLANPLISIIIPGKNEGAHLFKLTKSLAEQTYQNFELIIVDDGSDDQTPIIGRNLQKNGLIGTFIRNEMRGGKASAANLALRYTNGSIIVHLDADCSFDRDAIENIVIPFFMDEKIGAVGGNVKVRDYEGNLAATMQAIEYLKTISVGRIVASQLGIYKIISGAFGAFKADAIESIGGWDIGPGLDGDITVKIRKSGYKVVFEPSAICLTSVPATFKILKKQRLRWDKSIIRFRVRKHKDVYWPHAGFRWSTFLALFENVFYNVVLDFTWWIYIIDMYINYNSSLDNIILMNLTLYTVVGYIQMTSAYIYSERRKEELKLWPYVLFMSFYTGLFLRLVRTRAYFDEFLFKKSYDDPWNPVKSSHQAKINGF